MSFQAHVELLEWFLSRRGEIVERVQTLLNAQRKPPQYLRDAALLARHFESCFFTLAGIDREAAGLARQLDEAHWASGFKPRQTPGQPNDLVDAAELMTRAFHLWQRTRWPGREGRARYAQTLFNVYLLRRLMLLAMRIWDEERQDAGARLAQIQRVLGELWRTAPAVEPVLVRDARWLFPLAQSPTTDELHGYFEVAERIETTLAETDRLEIHKASVRMAGGHLRSQLRHVSTRNGVALADHGLVSSTRKSNALDLATLLQSLVPLLAAYEHAAHNADVDRRRELADTICQGISPDPELFLNRVDLLRPYSMIEHLFIATEPDGHAVYTPMGQRHLRLLQEYAERIGRVAKALHADCAQFRPIDGTYSPYGVLYGFSSQLLEHMALKTVQPGAETRFSLEDAFTSGGADKLEWVSGWRKLPHVPREVTKLFEYPQPFAVDMFERIERALRKLAAADEAGVAARTARLFVLIGAELPAESPASHAPDLPAEYFVSSDRHWAAAHKLEPCEETALLHGRTEGELVVSYRTPGGWVAISKDILTEVLGAGRDARIVGLPRDAGEVLKLMCPEVVVSVPS
jgi:hypothetical protein